MSKQKSKTTPNSESKTGMEKANGGAKGRTKGRSRLTARGKRAAIGRVVGNEKLTPMQAMFVGEYLKDLNGKRAAIRAGYAEGSAEVTASKLLRLTKVQGALSRLQRDISAAMQIGPEKVLREWGHIAFANTKDYIRVTEDGDAYIDLSNLTREQAAAISEIETHDYVDARNKDENGKAREVRRVKLKFHSKPQALEALSKHLGLFEADNNQRKEDRPEPTEDEWRRLFELLERAKAHQG